MGDVLVSDLKVLAEFLYSNYKIDFRDYAISSFRRRVQRILDLQKLDSVHALISLIKSDNKFLNNIISEITVNVTELFRDPSFWRELKNEIIPKLFANKHRVNIWHSGCSSGEEAFSMAILLKELGLLANARIYATDLDSKVLDRAKVGGGFNTKNMELNERNYLRFQGKDSLKNYCSFKDDKYYISDEILKSIEFSTHDLVQDSQYLKFDLVLCRNVMIYFNQDLQNKVLVKFSNSLHRYGYLGIGSKESLIWCDVANKFSTVSREEKIYKKIKD